MHVPFRRPQLDTKCDVGAATAFLSQDAARVITGETLYLDGGYHIIDWRLAATE
jgi:enoyl-[acyl-carrier-protein] reductase (NADH)